MKRGLIVLSLTLIVALFSVSCTEEPQASPSSVKSFVSDNASSEESILPSNASSEESILPSDTSSETFTEIIAEHTQYGKKLYHEITNDRIYYIFGKDGEETLCEYKIDTGELTAIGSSFHTHFRRNHQIIEFMIADKIIGFFVIETGELVEIPVVDELPQGLYAIESRKTYSFKYLNGKVYWVETNFNTEKDKVYCYDIEKDQRILVYESNGEDWVYNYFVTDNGLYLKLFPIVINCDHYKLTQCCVEPARGDVLFYDGKKITTVVADVYDFKLSDDGTPLIKKQTYTDNWEKIS